jgi:predicted XRE-type DNA-binding protein
MGFPSKSEIERARKKLAHIEPSRILPPDASKSDRLKFDLCKQFVRYLRIHKINQRRLAERIHIDPARMNEIVKYRVDLFTVDRLLEYAERLNPKLRVNVR